MQHRRNYSLWVGFLRVVAGLLSYIPFFALLPITRDFPWANLLLCFAGGILLCVGLARAFRRPELYRGRILGSILATLSIIGFTFFAYGLFYEVRQIPSSVNAPRIGQKAPDFTLPDQTGRSVALTELFSSLRAGMAEAKPKGVLLIFYRGYW